MGATGNHGASQPAADWYSDPTGRHEHRYWDGSTWTDHVADQGNQGRDSLQAPGASGPIQTAGKAPRLRPRLMQLPRLGVKVPSSELLALFGNDGLGEHKPGGKWELFWCGGDVLIIATYLRQIDPSVMSGIPANDPNGYFVGLAVCDPYLTGTEKLPASEQTWYSIDDYLKVLRSASWLTDGEYGQVHARLFGS